MLAQHLFTRKVLLLFACAGLLPAFGCRNHAESLESLNPGQLTWATYSNAAAGYSLSYPRQLRPDENDGNVFFRYNGAVPVVVRYTDEQEGKDRGAWFGHPVVDAITLGSRKGQKFIYDHWDGPFAVRTVSYVVKHREKFLGLEFRTDSELSEVQKQILSSFTFFAP